MRKLKKYKPTKFMAKTSHYDKDAADYAVMFIESLCHTKGTWAGKPFELIDWQEQIIRDLFGILKPNGYRQFNTAYVEIPKKMGKSELAAAVALPYLLMTDYDRDGVLLILLFWFTRKGGAANGLIQVAAMIVMWQFLFTGRAIMIGTFEFQTQCFALCALPLIWLYNGQKGSRSKALQYTAYAFYPAHLFILGIIFMIRVSTMAS